MPAEYDFPAVPLTRFLDDAATAFPTSAAVMFLGTVLTYRELKAEVDAVAGGLAAMGVGLGDRVVVLLPNCPQHVITVYAVLRLGAVVVEIDPLTGAGVLAQLFADASPRVVVCLDKTYRTVAAARTGTSVEHVVVASLEEFLPRRERLRLRLPVRSARTRRAEITAEIPAGDPVRLFAALRRTGQPAGQAVIDPTSDLALLQYTAGVTGPPRGVQLTHAAVVANAYQLRLWLAGSLPGREVTLVVLPLSHPLGQVLGLHTTVLLAGRLVLLPRFDLDLLLRAVVEQRPTVFPAVPAVFQRLVDSGRLDRTVLRSVRACIAGAASLPPGLQEAFREQAGVPLAAAYGLAETSAVTHCSPLSGSRPPMSVGLPLTGTTCRVVHPEDPSREAPLGERGELAVGGPQVATAYWGAGNSPLPTTPDGLLLTGDFASMDADGFLTVVDRVQDTVGDSVPADLEDAVRAVEGVADVAVVGVGDGGTADLRAYVVRAPGAVVTAEEVAERSAVGLDGQQVEFRDRLPRSTVGVVLRRVLPGTPPAPLAEAASVQVGSEVQPTSEVPEPPPAQEPAAPSVPVKKTPPRKAPAKRAGATKTPVKRSSATGISTKKAPVKRASTARTPAKRTPTKRSPAAPVTPAEETRAPAQGEPAPPASED